MKAPFEKNPSCGSHATVLMFVFVHVAPPSVDSAWNVSIIRLAGSFRLSNRVASKAIDGDIGSRGLLDGSLSCRFGLSANWPGLSIWTGAPKLVPPFVERVKNMARSYAVLQSSLT